MAGYLSKNGTTLCKSAIIAIFISTSSQFSRWYWQPIWLEWETSGRQIQGEKLSAQKTQLRSDLANSAAEAKAHHHHAATLLCIGCPERKACFPCPNSTQGEEKLNRVPLMWHSPGEANDLVSTTGGSGRRNNLPARHFAT